MKKLITHIAMLLLISSSALYAQSTIRVQGVVRGGDGVAIESVNMIVDQEVVGRSDIDGNFSIVLSRDAEVLLYHPNYDPIVVAVEGRQIIDVELVRNNTIIASESGSKSRDIAIDDTDMRIQGEYFYLSTKFRVPKKMMARDKCFILQPMLYDITSNIRYNMRPVVINGDRYEVNRRRRLEFDESNDSLISYVVDNDLDNTLNIYSYADSVRIDSRYINDKYRAECYLMFAGTKIPRDIPSTIDTVIISQGVRNTLRFMECLAEPMDWDQDTLHLPSGEQVVLDYTEVIPTPVLQLSSDRVSAYIEFEVDQSVIDYSRGDNQRNIDEVRSVLHGINSDPNMSLKSISMVGYTSPDGRLEHNKELSTSRAHSLLDLIEQDVDPVALRYAELSYEGHVQPWTAVVDLLRGDGLALLADSVARVVAEFGDYDLGTQMALMKMEEYEELFKTKYLPLLRRVDYTFDYTWFRARTVSEICDLIASTPAEASRHDYYKVIANISDSLEVVGYEQMALDRFPNFTWVVNRAASRLLRADSVSLSLMSPLLGRDVPYAVSYNHAIMALRSLDYKMADSLLSDSPRYVESQYLDALVSAFNGRFEEAYPHLVLRGGLDAVMIMLSVNYNDEAYELINELITQPAYVSDAKAWYLRATCANRVKDLGIAMSSLSKALSLDGSLADVAENDLDVLDIYGLILTR